MKDPDLRAALVRLANRAESGGPAGMGCNMATPDGRRGWADVQRAIRWIYEQAIDPLVDRGVPIDADAADR